MSKYYPDMTWAVMMVSESRPEREDFLEILPGLIGGRGLFVINIDYHCSQDVLQGNMHDMAWSTEITFYSGLLNSSEI